MESAHPAPHDWGGEGCYFKDADGNTFLDFASNVAATPLGYNHPAMKAVLKSVREYIGKEPEIDHPSINLEQFFLDVVDEAHRAASHPSGVSRGGGAARYLIGENAPP